MEISVIIGYFHLFNIISLSSLVIFHLTLWFKHKGSHPGPKAYDAELPGITIITPAYKEEQNIERSLKNLLTLSYPKDKLEVIVVDDGSHDDTYKIAKQFESKNFRVFTKVHAGKAAALNFGIRKAKFGIVAVRDADSFLEKDTLQKCIPYFNEPQTAAVTPRILAYEPRTFWEIIKQYEGMTFSIIKRSHELINAIGVTQGPLALYKKDILLKVGGFDEKIVTEDIEIAWRLLKNGYSIKMAFGAQVYTIYPNTLGMLIKGEVRALLGHFQSIIRYAGYIFNPKAHAVGLFIIPMSLVTFFFAMTSLGTSLYLLFANLISYALLLSFSVSAGVNPIFSPVQFSYDSSLLGSYSIISITLILLLTFLAFRANKTMPNPISLLLFFMVYPLVLNISLVIALFKLARGEQGWLTK